MGKCTNHPDKETNFLCMKHNIYLCEQCLKCRDPKIHCKFRSSCPIWFMEKRGGKEIDATPMEKKKEYTVVFKPDSKEVLVSEEATLLDAALTGNILLNASCNGNGSCGKCKLVLESGTGKRDDTPLLTRQEKEQKSVLACQAIIQSDVIVRILEETIEKKLKIAGMGKEITARMQGLVRGISPMHCFCLIQIWMIFPV